jgi:hypothetical protein
VECSQGFCRAGRASKTFAQTAYSIIPHIRFVGHKRGKRKVKRKQFRLITHSSTVPAFLTTTTTMMMMMKSAASRFLQLSVLLGLTLGTAEGMYLGSWLVYPYDVLCETPHIPNQTKQSKRNACTFLTLFELLHSALYLLLSHGCSHDREHAGSCSSLVRRSR